MNKSELIDKWQEKIRYNEERVYITQNINHKLFSPSEVNSIFSEFIKDIKNLNEEPVKRESLIDFYKKEMTMSTILNIDTFADELSEYLNQLNE